MAYTINNTAGATLAQLQAGTTTTVGGITLIGKNYTGYGEIIAEDFVRLLENQANSSQPSGALQGQLWYDTSENILKVYNSANWDRLGTTVGASAPSGLTSGTIKGTFLSILKYFELSIIIVFSDAFFAYFSAIALPAAKKVISAFSKL